MHLTHSNLSFGTDINDINLVDDLNVFISSEPFLTVIIAVYSVIVVCGGRKENILRVQLNIFLSVLGNLAVMLTVVFIKEDRKKMRHCVNLNLHFCFLLPLQSSVL